ncbi:MAG: oligosaccharide flippase family protein [Pseudomonadota bacterium]
MITHPLTQPDRRLISLVALLSGNSAIAALTLLRNIFVARLIGVDQFGIAAALAIAATSVEMATNLGTQQMLVRDGRGDAPRFQASLQFVQLIRGLFGAALLYFLAPMIADFFNMSGVTWAFRTLALLPLAAGVLHLDAFRYQRAGRFGPTIAIGLGPALLALLMVWPLFQKYGDFRVLLIASLIQGFGTLIMTHLVAERRFLIRVERRHWRSVWRFGAPMALNGALLLGVFHGEKILLAHLRTPGDLALIAMGFTLTLTPALILGRSLQTYALPRLSQIANPSEFRAQANLLMLLCLGIALATTAVLSSISPAIPILLGPEFAELQALFPLLAVLHGLRIVRSGPSVIALAKGCSINAALGNVPRICALPVVYVWLAGGGSIAGMLWIAIVAELAGLALAYLRMRQTLKHA